LTDALIFGCYCSSRFAHGAIPPAHKRYIYVATTALLMAAIARWLGPSPSETPSAQAYCRISFCWRWRPTISGPPEKFIAPPCGPVHFLIFVEILRFPIAETSAWHSFAGWVQSAAL